MKNIFLLLFLTIMACYVQAQEIGGWSVKLKVINDNQEPVPHARVWVAYGNPQEGASLDPFQTNDWAVAGLTDSNGCFQASQNNNHSWTLGLHIQKDGYYPIATTYELAGHANSTRDLDLTWILKKIIKPIPMYAKSITSLEFPQFNKPIGYDLMIGDWVGPYGKGISADILFTENHTNADSGYTFTVSFPNVGDGLQEFSLPPTRFPGDGSALRSAQTAPIDGYQPQYIQAGMPDQNRNYYFRVRTQLDHNGNVVSAHYGKIYGDFMQFRYYLNPTPNDRNIEFDPQKNLLQGLPSFEQVQQP